jgi:hypothetical protein
MKIPTSHIFDVRAAGARQSVFVWRHPQSGASFRLHRHPLYRWIALCTLSGLSVASVCAAMQYEQIFETTAVGSFPAGMHTSNAGSDNTYEVVSLPVRVASRAMRIKLQYVNFSSYRAENSSGNSSWRASNVVTALNGGGTVTLHSIGAEVGNILESGENTNVGGTVGSSGSTDIYAGDGSANKQDRSILSFDGSSVPDGATIQSATLRLCRSSVTSASPFCWGGQWRIDIQNGALNGNAALAAADFQAAASATSVAQMSNAAPDNAWSTGSLNASGRAQINKTGKTQLRLYFSTDDNNDGSADFMNSQRQRRRQQTGTGDRQ